MAHNGKKEEVKKSEFENLKNWEEAIFWLSKKIGHEKALRLVSHAVQIGTEKMDFLAKLKIAIWETKKIFCAGKNKKRYDHEVLDQLEKRERGNRDKDSYRTQEFFVPSEEDRAVERYEKMNRCENLKDFIAPNYDEQAKKNYGLISAMRGNRFFDEKIEDCQNVIAQKEEIKNIVRNLTTKQAAAFFQGFTLWEKSRPEPEGVNYYKKADAKIKKACERVASLAQATPAGFFEAYAQSMAV